MIVGRVQFKEPQYVNGQTVFGYSREHDYEIRLEDSLVVVQHKLETVAAVFPVCALAYAITMPDPTSDARNTLPPPAAIILEAEPAANLPEEVTRVTRRPRAPK